MKNSLLALTLLLGATMAPLAAAEVLPRLISVSATDYVEAVPDEMVLTVTVKATELSYEEAKEAVDKTTHNVLKAAADTGIAEDDVDSSQLSAYREMQWDNKRREQVYKGDSVQREISMTLRDLEAYANLLRALSELEVHNISRPLLRHSQLESLKDAALRKALAKAKAKAALMAGEMNVEVGAVYSMSDSAHTATQTLRLQRGLAMAAMSEGAMADAAGEEAVKFGSQRIAATVHVAFEMR